jgi:basic membrane protein A
MATVYKAYQPSMDRYVALKVLPRFHSSDPEFLGRFEQEAKALAQLQHPFILPVYDYGESEGYTYFVMPLMQNGNLAELMADKRLPLDRIQQIISQVGSALDYAHMRGFIHRDVKPSNVLLDETGNCVLMDFGIAKIIEGSREFTKTGGIIGTPVYMSPEQGSGQKIDHKSDIYSLGIILYEMATGRPPFEAETPIAVIFKHVHDPLPPPSSLNPDLPEEVERVILKSLAKDPEDRYESVREMVDALSKAVTASFLGEPTEVEIAPTIGEPIDLTTARSLKSQGLEPSFTKRTVDDPFYETSSTKHAIHGIFKQLKKVRTVLLFGVVAVAVVITSFILLSWDQLGLSGVIKTERSPTIEAIKEIESPTSNGPSTTETEAPQPTEVVELTVSTPSFIACQVSVIGGTDDKSFNQFAWVGMERAKDELGTDIRFLESTSEADYVSNLNAFTQEGCDLIFGVGFQLNDATEAAAEANPDVDFVGIDQWSDSPSNFLGTFYNIHEATMLAGYLAAGMTETGIVGIYAGVNIPPVTAFSDGFYLGIQAYNDAHGTDVQLIGWDPVTQDGLFTGDFDDTVKGRTMTETLLDQGADIIMPVAGPVGEGSLALFEERGVGLFIGVDVDWSSFYPDQAEFILATVMKRMDLVVFDSVAASSNGTFEGGNYTGTLENGRVSMNVGSAWVDRVPHELMAEIGELSAQIISGEVSAVYYRAD